MKNTFVILFFAVLLTACVSTPTNVGTSDYNDAKYTLHYNMGIARLSGNEPSFAMEEFLAAEKYKKVPELYFSMGQACYMLKRYDLAISYFDKSLSIDKNYSSSYVGKGIVLRELGRYDEAIAEFNKALDNILFHEPEKAYYNIALTYLAMKDQEKAVTYFKSTIQIKEDFLPPYYQLALVYLSLKDYEGVAEITKRLLGYAPDSPDAHLLLGKAYLKLNKAMSADAEFKEVIRLSPDSDSAREAQVLLMGGDN